MSPRCWKAALAGDPGTHSSAINILVPSPRGPAGWGVGEAEGTGWRTQALVRTFVTRPCARPRAVVPSSRCHRDSSVPLGLDTPHLTPLLFLGVGGLGGLGPLGLQPGEH